MQSFEYYDSPLGKILLAADEEGLTGLWFEGQKYYPGSVTEDEKRNMPALEAARKWLDVYFSGKNPGPFQPLHLIGTEFQKSVWNILLTIPYGQTMTYGGIAKRMAKERGTVRVSSQAVGGAVGHNPVSIIVPCHRVVGADGSLTGYAGGVRRKEALLRLEHAYTDAMYVPEKGTAL